MIPKAKLIKSSSHKSFLGREILSVLLAKDPDISSPMYLVKQLYGSNINSTQPGDVPRSKSKGLGYKTGPQQEILDIRPKQLDFGLVHITSSVGYIVGLSKNYIIAIKWIYDRPKLGKKKFLNLGSFHSWKPVRPILRPMPKPCRPPSFFTFFC